MKNYLTLLVIVILTSNCTNPEKANEKVSEPDSLTAIVSPADLAESSETQDTVTLDQVKSSSTIFNKADSQSYFILSNYFTSVTESNARADIQVIDSTCAVLVYPTDEQLSSLKKDSPDEFATIVDDNSYYHGIAIEMLDSINVETINAETRYLAFKARESKTWTLDIRREGAPAWNLIFFSTRKEPQIVPRADLSHQRIIEYFDIKNSAK